MLRVWEDGRLIRSLSPSPDSGVIENIRELFGFILEGRPDPEDVDADAVHLHSFRVTDPSGDEQAERDAAYAQAREAMGPPRVFRMGPDGHMYEVGLGSL